MTYADFLEAKQVLSPADGIEVSPEDLHPSLFGFQRDLTRWALRKGRAAIFADAGLGKTFMQLDPKANDERHVAPLQLGTIERCVRLWSNPGETVLSPFAGIASEGYVSVRLGRRFVGVELKPEYFRTAIDNLRKAEVEREEVTLFDREVFSA